MQQKNIISTQKMFYFMIAKIMKRKQNKKINVFFTSV